MKKFIFIVVAALVVLSSCTTNEETKEEPGNSNGGNPATAVEEGTPEVTNTPTPRVPGTTSAPTSEPTLTPTPTPMLFEASEEIINADVYSGKVQVLDTVITLPCKLGELMDVVDVEMKKSLYAGVNGYDPLNDTYAAGSNNIAILHMPLESEVEATVENLGLEPVAMEELYVTKLISKSTQVFFPKGVSAGVNYTIIKEWGEHDEITTGSRSASYSYNEAEYMTSYGSERVLGASFTVEVNNSTDEIDSIEFSPAFYVDTTQVTEVTYNTYLHNLKYEIPLALEDYYKAGVLMYDGKRYIVTYDIKYIFPSATTAEELLAEMGRAMQYYDETGWYSTWRDTVDTLEENNDKQVIQDTEEIITVVNYWDYFGMSAKEGIMLDGVQMLPTKSTEKYYAEVGVLLDGDVESWEFSLEAQDGGDVPEEVQQIFREIVYHMANTMMVYEEE